MMHTYNGILLSLQKIIHYATTWMNFEDIILSEISQPWKINTAGFYLSEIPKIAKFIDSKDGMVVSRGWAEGKRGITNHWT